MMKQNVRFTAALTAVLLAAGLLSCGDTDNTEPETAAPGGDSGAVTEAVTENMSAYAALETKDFGGMAYNVFEANTWTEMHVNIPGDKLTGETVNDALFNRDIDIESRYNIDITYQQEADTTKLKNSVLAGDSAYNLVMTTLLGTGGLQGLQSSGVLANLCEVPQLSLDQSWWSPLMYESLQLQGAMYYTTGDMAPSIYQAPCCMFLNLKLYGNYDIQTDIYDLVINGKWTWDELYQITADMDSDLNNDGKLDLYEDSFGFIMSPGGLTAQAFLGGAGINLCEITEDGDDIALTLGENAADYNKIDNMIRGMKSLKQKVLNDMINVTFKNDRALILQHALESAVVHLRDMESDFLVLPDPKADEAQEHYRSFVSGWVAGFVGIPGDAEPETTGLITEAMARYSHEYIRPAAYDMVYKEKTTRDPRSAEVLDILFDNLYIDFASVYNFGGCGDMLGDVFFNAKPLASTLEQRRPAIEKDMKTFVETWLPTE